MHHHVSDALISTPCHPSISPLQTTANAEEVHDTMVSALRGTLLANHSTKVEEMEVPPPFCQVSHSNTPRIFSPDHGQANV